MTAQDDDLIRIRAYLDRTRREGRARLPPEGKLALELGVTRGRLRALLKRLEGEGLIWRHVGKGTFLGQRTLTADISSLASMINPLEAFEARLLVEPQLAALAALRASPREIEEMTECLERMRALRVFDEWAVWDERLHRVIAKAAHNTLMLAVYDAVRESAPTGMRNRIQQVYSRGPKPETNVEHEAYVQAIAERDPEQAEALMRAHLQSVRKTLFGDR